MVVASVERAQPQNGAVVHELPRHPVPERLAAILQDGVAAHQKGDTPAAAAAYQAALLLDPTCFDAHNNLAVALRSMGQPAEALAHLEAAVAAAPDRTEGYYNRGNALSDVGRLDEAVADYQAALAINPTAQGAWRNLAGVYGRLRRVADELAAYRQLLTLDPANADWWNNLGAALYARGSIAASLACTRRAVALRPGFVVALKNLGVTLAHAGDYAEASVVLGRAVAAGGLDAATLSALGQALVQTGDATGAGQCFTRALAADPRNLDARLGLARSAFLSGDLEQAWQEYEWRWRLEGNPMPDGLGTPMWQGEDIAGKTLLVWAEQGIGDTLQFVRYLALLRRRGARVVAMVQPPVASVVATVAGADVVMPAGGGRPHFDLHAPLLSLPRLLGGGKEPLAERVPYLSTPPGTSLPPIPALDRPGLRVGVVWAGNPDHKNDRNRSLPIETLLPVCAVPGTRFFSLQKGPAVAQLTSSGAETLIHDLSPLMHSYAETAALLDRLDLVISVDTSVVHLAGAMGKRVWCMLPFAPDWRWELWRSDTAWYPTMRLFRQLAPGNWGSVIAEVTRALAQEARPMR